MRDFFRNLGFGGQAKPLAARSWGAYEAGASGPESFDQFNPLGADVSTGYDPYDPQFGAVGLGVDEEYDPATGTRKKKRRPSAKETLAAAAKLGQPADITQGMPAATPFRLTGGLLR